MAHHETSESQSGLPQAVECVLRAVLLTEGTTIPLTPDEVAFYDTHSKTNSQPAPRPPRTPSFLFSWERADAPPVGAKVVSFPSPIAAGLALAARADAPVSNGTRTKLCALVAEMRNGTDLKHS
jgi:hypothetical protein